MYKTLLDRLDNNVDIRKAVFQTRNSYKCRTHRLKKRIEQIIEYDHKYFITFTLKDEHINKSMVTYLDKIKLCLKDINQYVFNVDYGKEKERLHFHAVIGTDIDISYKDILKKWGYGAVNFKPIITIDSKSITKYINKLRNHAIKDTANKIHYSKKKRK